MTPGRWKQIREILEPAVEIPPAARAAFLSERCGNDANLRAEIEALLTAERDSEALEQIPFPVAELNNGSKNRVGERIGKYEITGDLGSGGMGSVYLARRIDGSFEQTVALKLIKRGMDSEAIHKRFSNERRILASLDHPNIARLIDGGTTNDGQPYFVMEFVQGESIFEYASKNSLGLSERLDLFREVCSAVSYAHQNLVIHRDLKPSNILVNQAGAPKLLDFGIAKLLRAEHSSDTATQQFVFTPEYASPEQIRGENLTTATDIYSLGVVLYELLTGVRPFAFDGKNFGQIVMTATQTNPIRPSEKRHKRPTNASSEETSLPFPATRLRGDLDNIVLKALRKEPERRYSSVEQFSEDVRRHLRGLPVHARENTWLYRSQTFVRRNPILVGAIATAFLILIAGIAATTVLARRAEAERVRAERRFNDVRSIANSLIFEVNEKIDESPIKARELLVTRSVEYLDKLAAEAGNDAGLRAELAASYEKIGDVQAYHFGSGTGDIAGALENHRKSLAIRESLAASFPNELQYKRYLAASYLKIADLSVTSGKTAAALEKYDLAVSAIESARELALADQAIRLELARAYGKRGQGILRSGSISKALENYEKAIDLMNEAAAFEPASARVRHGVSVYRSYSGYAKLEMGRLDDAIADFADALRIDSELLRAEPGNLELVRNYASSEQWLGTALRHGRRFDDSREHLKKALDEQIRLHQVDPSNSGDLNSLADAYLEIGWTERDSGNYQKAVDYLQKAIAHYEAVSKKDPNNVSARRQISFTKRNLGEALIKKGDRGEALALFTSALRASEDLVQSDPENTEFRYDKAICIARLGEYSPHERQRLQEAEQILVSLVAASPERITWIDDLGQVRKLMEGAKKL